jgi:hypothetical protein
MVMAGLYLLFALFDYAGGFDNMLGLMLFHPVMAVMLTAPTIGCCLVIGLPIRLVKSINQWWTRHFLLSVALTFTGFGLLGLSLIPQFMEQKMMMEGQRLVKQIPNFNLAVTGWFLTAFSTLHTYPPEGLITKVKTKVLGMVKI